MEALGCASSVFAIISLAGQLADGLQKLIKFWNSVKNAPAELTDLCYDLQLLSSVLANTRRIGNTFKAGPSLEEILQACEIKISKLQHKVNSALVLLNSKGRCKRTLVAIKTILKIDDILLLKRLISDTISTLQLAQNNSLL